MAQAQQVRHLIEQLDAQKVTNLKATEELPGRLHKASEIAKQESNQVKESDIRSLSDPFASFSLTSGVLVLDEAHNVEPCHSTYLLEKDQGFCNKKNSIPLTTQSSVAILAQG